MGMTLLVGILLSIAAYSFAVDATGGCRIDRSKHVRWDVVPFAQRVQIALGIGNSATPPYAVAVNDPEVPAGTIGVELVRMRSGPMAGKLDSLAVAAVLFAAFGLFILWWGRDMPSLWLGLFCAAYAPGLSAFYGPLPEGAMLAAWTLANVLAYVAAFALYAMAESFALASVAQDGRVRQAILVARGVVIAGLGIGLLGTLDETFAPIVDRVDAPALVHWLHAAGNDFSEIAVKLIAPVVLLAVAWRLARDPDERQKNAIIFATVVTALSGVALSLMTELGRGASPGFETSWFTLLAIPIGFIITIPTYKVVDVQVVVKRILIVATMTAIVGAAIAGSELLVERWADPMLQRWAAHGTAAAEPAPRPHSGWEVALQFGVAFVIVLTFGSVHHWLEETFKRIIFAKRDRGIADLHAFASRRAGVITLRASVIAQALALVHDALCARAVAFYELRDAAFERADARGPAAAARIGIDDPVAVALRSDQERVDLRRLHGEPSALGREGFAFRLAVRGHVNAILFVGGRDSATDGAYEIDELEAVSDVARGVADALFSLRAAETAAFLGEVADGSISGARAAVRAAQLRDEGVDPALFTPRLPAEPPAAADETPAVAGRVRAVGRGTPHA
ncbi:hypothetical protein [Vulcanimicrobium alpinum]|uniref:hypothetical protein n=1 Tax=Vulcanimicrobium alpinum TaxID=3016050 RepID=UPI00295E9A0E|nr:hypothetical protein [Vulcanimicrobium alpinum]